ELRGRALLDEDDGVLLEAPAERLGVGPRNSDEQNARLRTPASLGVAALARQVRPGERGEELAHRGLVGGVTSALAARVGRSDESRSSGALHREQAFQRGAGLADAQHRSSLQDIERLLISPDQIRRKWHGL